MNQALEKQYNKTPAKGPSGIIRFTRCKEVCQWNIIKHEKFLYSKALSEICQLKTEDQYSLHHESSETATLEEREAVAKMIQFIEERGNPFDVSSTEMKNLSSDDRGVLRPNERPCTVWAPKLGLGKKKQCFLFCFVFIRYF